MPSFFMASICLTMVARLAEQKVPTGKIGERFLPLRTAILAWVALLFLSNPLCAQSSLEVGYSVFSADIGSSLPVGAALFRVSDSAGVVVSEAGVGSAKPIATGRIFIDEIGTKMGLALAPAATAGCARW